MLHHIYKTCNLFCHLCHYTEIDSLYPALLEELCSLLVHLLSFPNALSVFQIHESSDGSLSMTIHSTTLDHTGQYEVVASNSAGTAKCVAYLSIEPRLPTPPPTDNMEPPVFTKLLNDTVVTAGNSVKFEAEVTGVPAPTVSDLEVSSPTLSLDSGESALHIMNGDTMATACVNGINNHEGEKVIDENGNDTSYIDCQNTPNNGSGILGMNDYLNIMSKFRLDSSHLESKVSESDNLKETKEGLLYEEKDSCDDKKCDENFEDSDEGITGDGREFQVKEDTNDCEENHYHDRSESAKDETEKNCCEDSNNFSKFHSMKILDMETYSRMMMENVVVYGSLDDSPGMESTNFDQFEKYHKITVLPAEDCLVVPDESKSESLIDQEEEKEEEFNVYSDTEEGLAEASQKKPSQFIDLGLSEELQPVKLADLWNLIKDKLPNPKAGDTSSNEATPQQQSDDGTCMKNKSVSLCSEGDHDSGYFSNNFSPNTPCSESSVGSPQSGRSKRNSFTLTSEDISRCSTPGEDHLSAISVVSKNSGSEKNIAESTSSENSKTSSCSGQSSSEMYPKEVSENSEFNDTIVTEGVKSLGESMKLYGKELKPIEECSPDSDEGIDEKLNFTMIENSKYEDAYISKVDMSLETEKQDDCNNLDKKEDKNGRDVPCTLNQTCLDHKEQKNKKPNGNIEVSVRRFLAPECEYVSEYLRCPSSLSVISEESCVSDYEENTQISNDSNNNEDCSSKHSKTDTTSQTIVGKHHLVSQPVSRKEEPVTKEDDNYEKERKARRAARLAKLKELTQMLQKPSKISENDASHVESHDVHTLNSSVVSRVTLDTQVNSSLNLGDLLEKEGSHHPEEYGDPKQPNNAMVFVVKTVGQLSRMEMKQIINEKMQAAVGAGRALVRAFVLPFSEAMFIDLSNPAQVHEAPGSPMVEYGRSVVFETCLHATRGQGLAFDGETLDQDIPFLVQAGYYLIYVLYYKATKENK